MKKTYLIFLTSITIILCLFSFDVKAQCENGETPPSNDNCSTPYNLGILPNPLGLLGCQPDSGIALGNSINIISSNICATAESPYYIIANCENGSQATLAADVWYSFVATGTSLQAQITSLGNLLQTPNVSLYEYNGSCSSLIARKCVVGENGITTLVEDVITIGQTYYLQISGNDIDDQSEFTLIVRNNYDCTQCLLESSITFPNTTPLNNTFNCGETVVICYTVEKYNQIATNWFHGIVPIFGEGWDFPNSFIAGNMPNSCSGEGEWGWYNNVTSNNTGITYGPGWYYDSSNGGPLDGNPVNNWGDQIIADCSWQFCFQINTLPCNIAVEGMDLSIEFENYGDSESGSWYTEGCENDPNFVFEATINNIGLTNCPYPTNRTETFDINGPNTLRLSWNGSNQATTYEIAGRKVGGNGSWLFWTTTNTYRDFSGLNNGTYEWSVRAICDDNETSDWVLPAQEFTYNSAAGKTNTPNPFESENIAAFSHFNIYPNPANSQVSLEFRQNIADENVEITIYDMLGKKVLQQKQKANLGTNTIILDIEHLQKACYFVKINNGKEQITEKLMVF